MGYSYYHGEGIETNHYEALKWFNLSANQGESLSQAYIGTFYERGYAGLERDYHEAMKCYRLAARKGDSMAQCFIGRFYEQGIGVDIDLQEALKWYSLSKNQGNEIALRNYERLLLEIAPGQDDRSG